MSAKRTVWVGGLLLWACLLGLWMTTRFPAPLMAESQEGSLRAGDHEFSLSIENTTRHYRVHVPRSHAPGIPAPVVIVLHGYGGNSRNGLAQGRWSQKADQAAFIVVAPDALPRDPSQPAHPILNPQAWESVKGMPWLQRDPVDDVGFIRILLDDLSTRLRVDPQRIYVTGFSNGAAMAFRLGAELSDRVAAIAPVSNVLLIPFDSIQLQNPVSLLLIFGNSDPINPIAGGSVTHAGSEAIRPSAEASWRRWGEALQCSHPMQEWLDHDPGSGVMVHRFTSCPRGEALFYQVNGMGHVWPGGRNFLPEQVTGPMSSAIKATEVIWEFFQRHPLP